MTTMAIEKPAEQDTDQTEPTHDRPEFRPRVDIVERPDELSVRADLPGTRADDVDIHFEDGTLTLRAKVADRGPQETAYVVQEYGVGDFHRTFRVSEAIDSPRISAEYADGVLILHLPKTEAVKPRQIAVKAS